MTAPAINRLKVSLKCAAKPRGRSNFIQSIPANGRVLDVGCGNDSPTRTKQQRPDLFYIGLDVADYNQSVPPRLIADSYILTSPEKFAEEIEKFEGTLDAVVSSHNIEHCLDPMGVLRAMLRSLRGGGALYMAFPCEESVSFPKRKGTLNFYDDPTHVAVPDYRAILREIEAQGCKVDFARKRYRPSTLYAVGLVTEPINALRRGGNPGTWALYGFESVIWATRPKRG